MNTKNLMAILAMCLAAISLQAQSSHPIKIGSSFLELVNHFGNPSRTNGGNWVYWPDLTKRKKSYAKAPDTIFGSAQDGVLPK